MQAGTLLSHVSAGGENHSYPDWENSHGVWHRDVCLTQSWNVDAARSRHSSSSAHYGDAPPASIQALCHTRSCTQSPRVNHNTRLWVFSSSIFARVPGRGRMFTARRASRKSHQYGPVLKSCVHKGAHYEDMGEGKRMFGEMIFIVTHETLSWLWSEEQRCGWWQQP